jgi:hypothetical protein
MRANAAERCLLARQSHQLIDEESDQRSDDTEPDEHHQIALTLERDALVRRRKVVIAQRNRDGRSGEHGTDAAHHGRSHEEEERAEQVAGQSDGRP